MISWINKEKYKVFVEDTSLHGIKYCCVSGYTKRKRLTWAVFMLFAVAFIIYTTTDLIIRVLHPPLVTDISVLTPRFAAFPTVTICNQNQYRKEYYQDHPEHQLLLRSTYPDFLDTFNKSDFNPDNPHYHLEFQNVTDIYVKAAHNIPERIIQCRWKLKEVNCSKYFHVVMAEFGVCHQFEYANLTVDNTGVGLYLIMDVEQDSYMFGENYGVSGLKVVIHSKGESPSVMAQGVNAPPGTETLISLKKSQTSLSRYTKCEASTDYSIHHCYQDCKAACIHKHCECTLFYLSGKQANYSICNTIPKTICAKDYELKCGKLHEYTECHKRCPLPCTIIEYRRGVSYGGFPHLQYLEAIQRSHIDKVQPNRSKLNYRENAAAINIYFESLLINNVIQKAGYTWNQIWGDLGGQLGLALGASILTILEIIEFCCTAACGICDRESRNKNHPV